MAMQVLRDISGGLTNIFLLIPETDLSTLTSLIKDCLLVLHFPLVSVVAIPVRHPTCQAIGTGVAAQIQKEETLALYVHCRTNLCLQAVGKQSKLVYNALDLVVGLSKLINFSPK